MHGMANPTLTIKTQHTLVDPTFTAEYFTGIAKVVTVETGGHRMENTEEMLVKIEKDICS
jgi:hypothetical protein